MARKLRQREKQVVRGAETMLRARLPSDWLIRRRAAPGDSPFDAQLTIGPSSQESATIHVTAKPKVGPRDVQPLTGRWTDAEADGPRLLVAPYLSPRTRQLLEAAGANYVDNTGNVLVRLRRPAMFIRMSGADTDPCPVQSKLRSLKGPAASRVVRALLDFRPPYGIASLAERAGSPLSTVHRVIDLVDKEGLLEREPRGPITSVDWEGLLQRWITEYGLAESNRVERYIEPRGLDRLLDRLRSSELDYAVTGSLAAARLEPIAPVRLIMVFVGDSVEDAAETLGLRPVDYGANVLLIEPFDRVALERCETDDGIRYAAPSQVAADLAKSPGRGPNEGAALVKWMAANEDAWRS
jgi:hypothetical protein